MVWPGLHQNKYKSLMELKHHSNTTLITSRTRYQLKHFVIDNHPTAPMRWRQILLETQDLLYKIRSAEIHQQKQAIERDRLIATGDPIDALDAEQKQLDMILTERTLIAAKQELEWLQEIAEEIGVFTFEEIEADQPDYWVKRLKQQADLDVLSVQQGIGVGNLTSMLNAGMLAYTDSRNPLDKPEMQELT